LLNRRIKHCGLDDDETPAYYVVQAGLANKFCKYRRQETEVRKQETGGRITAAGLFPFPF
jgi:hypothetical protein